MNKVNILKAVCLGVLMAAASVKAQTATYFQTVMGLNPAGYWPMHEVEPAAPGDTETNYGSLGLWGTGYYPDWTSANANIIQRQVPGALAGDADTAVYFGFPTSNNGGTTNALYVPHISPLSTLAPPFSVECWFMATNNSNGQAGDIWSQNGYEGLNAGNNGGGAGNVCGIRLYWNGPGFNVYTYDNSSTANLLGSVIAGYATNQWYHVVVAADANTNISLYVNGSLQFTTPAAGLYAPDYWTPFEVGNGRGNTRAVRGVIDEVAIYTNVLADIGAHYTAGTSVNPDPTYFQLVTNDAPVIYYRMDSPTYVAPELATWPVLTNYGTTAINGVYTPGTLPGILTGPVSATGIPFTSLSGTNVAQFSGVSSFADVGNEPVFNPKGATPFSVAAMFRGNPSDCRFQNIIGHSDSSWRLAINNNGKLQYTLGTNSASVVNSAKIYNDGNWHLAVAVYTPGSSPTTPGTNALYVDGLLDTQVSNVSTNGIGPGSPLDMLIAADPQYTNNPAGLGRQFAGRVCEVAFFTNSLTLSQVQNLYNAAQVAPNVTSQPATGRNVNGGAGSYIYFGVAATGSASLAYQWYFNSNPNYNGAIALEDGAKYMDSTNDQVTVTNLGSGDNGYYFVVITNNYGSVTSQLASLTVNTNPVIISELPATYTNPFTLFAGANPAFSVTSVSGAAPLYYQWFTNGVAVDGATNTTLAMTDVQADFTSYCVVANSYGSATSVWNATVIVDPTAPYPQAVLADNPVGYWRLNEGPDNNNGNDGAICNDYMGGKNGIYTNVYLAQPGYSATDPETSVQFGEFGSTLPIINNYAGQIQGVDFASPTGTTTNFSVAVWANGYAGSMTTGDTVVSKGVYSLNDAFVIDISSASGHPYRFYIRGASGTVYNCNSKLAPDGNWHFLVGVCNESAGLVSFYVDGVLAVSTSIPTTAGLYEPSYPMTIGSVQSSSETVGYTLQFQGFINDLSVYNYALTVAQIGDQFAASGSAPIISQEPVAGTNISQGATLVVPAAVNGTLPLSIQWMNGNTGQPLAGQTNATLVVSNINASDSYYFTANNAYGSATSTTISVNVVAGAPQIYTDITPLSWTAYAGSSVRLAVTAYGTAPLYYQWYQDGTAISGATNATYIPAVQWGTNSYVCVVSNTFNEGSTATSSTAMVVGTALPADAYSLLVLSNGPVAYWRLGETNGNIAYDYVGGHDALYTNVQLGVTGSPADPDLAAEFGTLATTNSFAGEMDQSTNGIPNLDFSTEANAEFSVEAWVNGGSSQVSSIGLVAKGYSGAEEFCLDYYSGGFRFFVRDNANVTHICQSTIPMDGNWHHLVGVCDELNGLVHLYVDGVDAADTSVQAGKGVLAPGVATLPAADLVSIGARAASQSATYFADQFNGTMDDVAIYNYALDSAQVRADYQAATVVTPTISLTEVGNQLVIKYTGTLLSSPKVTGPYTPVTSATSPYTVTASEAQNFYRTSNP